MAMAVSAPGSAGSAQRVADAVDACGVTFRFVQMATGAIDGFRQHVVVGVLLSEVAVTTDAGISFVHRRGQPGGINEQRDFFAG